MMHSFKKCTNAISIFWSTVCSRAVRRTYIPNYRTMKDSGPFAAPSFMFVGIAKARWREDEKLISDSDQIYVGSMYIPPYSYIDS